METFPQGEKHMKKILSVLTLAAVGGVLALGSAQSKKTDVVKTDAATETTVYYAVPSDVVGTYTVKLNLNYKGDGDDWHDFVMSKETDTFAGEDVYSCTFTDAYNGVGRMQFQLYDGGNWISEQQPISSWTTVKTYNGKVYVHNEGWHNYIPNDTSFIDRKSVV